MGHFFSPDIPILSESISLSLSHSLVDDPKCGLLCDYGGGGGENSVLLQCDVTPVMLTTTTIGRQRRSVIGHCGMCLHRAQALPHAAAVAAGQREERKRSSRKISPAAR